MNQLASSSGRCNTWDLWRSGWARNGESGRPGGGRWTFEGVAYPTRSGMCRARRERYVALLDEGAELHSGRAHGGRVQAHRQGVAQRACGARRAVAGTGGGLIPFAHGRSQGHRRALSVSGRAHPDSRPARGRRLDTCHRPAAGPSGVDRQPRGAQEQRPRRGRLRAVPGAAGGRGPAQTAEGAQGCVCSIEVRPMQRNYSVRKSGRN